MWPYECIHDVSTEDACPECRKIGETKAADNYGGYELLIRPERIKLLEDILNGR